MPLEVCRENDAFHYMVEGMSRDSYGKSSDTSTRPYIGGYHPIRATSCEGGDECEMGQRYLTFRALVIQPPRAETAARNASRTRPMTMFRRDIKADEIETKLLSVNS